MKKEALTVPSAVLRDRQLSVLESIVFYLKTQKKLSYRGIAKLINRDDRTIYTCYSRAKKKKGMIKK